MRVEILFFFQAEDGIRDLTVTGVQTCALPISFLIDAKRAGKRIVAYGAPGKGNTLLNYCGIGTDFLDFTVDRNPHKQGKYTPGTHIPILHPDELIKARPDYVLILPWNLKEEILATVGRTAGLKARFVVPIPRVEIVAQDAG